MSSGRDEDCGVATVMGRASNLETAGVEIADREFWPSLA